MKLDLGKITEAILESYRTTGGLNNEDDTNLPSKRALASLCDDLLQLAFPGFHDQEPIASQHLNKVTRHRVFTLGDRLLQEVQKCLKLDRSAPYKQDAENLLETFLKALPRVRALLCTDVEAAFAGDPAASSTAEIIVAYPFVEAIAIQRMAHLLYNLGVPILPRMMTEWAHARTGIDIHPGATIGSHCFIDHGTGVVIGETATLGSHVKLYQGVSLIARSLSGGQALRGKKRHPTLEDHVTIYAGATIMGGDTVVGAGSTVAASVFLTHSVPPRSLVFYEERQLQLLDKDQRGKNWDDWVI
ncbi:MAG: serine acetyltransferase [Verrucomicrobiota bacterium]